MSYFHLPGNNGGVLLEKVIRIGPVMDHQAGHYFEVVCQHDVTFSVWCRLGAGHHTEGDLKANLALAESWAAGLAGAVDFQSLRPNG